MQQSEDKDRHREEREKAHANFTLFSDVPSPQGLLCLFFTMRNKPITMGVSLRVFSPTTVSLDTPYITLKVDSIT